jgi:hypothetical protein
MILFNWIPVVFMLTNNLRWCEIWIFNLMKTDLLHCYQRIC